MTNDEERAAKQAEAAARLAELVAKLKDAQSRLDSMIAESSKLKETLQQMRVERPGGSPNGA